MTPAVDATLSGWRSAFRALEDECPWPGPRPLTGADENELLIGRENDRRRFLGEVERHRLVLLSGESGVGKTSLIEVGLVPELRTRFTVALCRDWSGGADEEDPVAFLAGKVAGALVAAGYSVPASSGAELFWALERELPGNVVLVLDQFEELIRDAAALVDQLFLLLAEINQRTSIRLVISYRSEYVSKLAPLEQRAKPFTITHVELGPIDPEHADAVVLAGNRRDADAISVAAAKVIAKTWRYALGQPTRSRRQDRHGRIGLLHLQALIYSLHGRSPTGRITNDMVEELSRSDPADVFTVGMQDAIDLKLGRCRAAAAEMGIDDYLIEGTSDLVARSVGHLSSAGFKLVRGVVDLWDASLGEQQHEQLPRDHNDLVVAVTSTILDDGRQGPDLVSAQRADLAGLAPGWSDRLAAELAALPDELVGRDTCGPMMGLPRSHVLVEELRRYAFALEWLQAGSLIRISTPGHDGAMVSLIHDGFGPALERWSSITAGSPASALHALIAPRGAEFGWQFDGQIEPAHVALDGCRSSGVLANLRWRGAWVRASFRQVQFVNCDLRGAYFSGCRFQGVSFVNCVLDGAMFTESLISGAPRRSDSDYRDDPPVFLVPTSAELLATIARYRCIDTGEALLAPLPGSAAVPISDRDGATPFVPEVGGLTFYGGRISQMLLRNNRFVDSGGVGFREVAGSGLDIVEQVGGSFDIAASRVRHIVVTTSVDEATDADAPSLTLRLAGSIIAQCWIGDDIRGHLKAENCRLVQLWNGSSTFEAVATNCSHFDLVNVHIDDSSSLTHSIGGPATLGDADADGGLRDKTRAMDYRVDAGERRKR